MKMLVIRYSKWLGFKEAVIYQPKKKKITNTKTSLNVIFYSQD